MNNINNQKPPQMCFCSITYQKWLERYGNQNNTTAATDVSKEQDGTSNKKGKAKRGK